jgi:hypothetical protein
MDVEILNYFVGQEDARESRTKIYTPTVVCSSTYQLKFELRVDGELVDADSSQLDGWDEDGSQVITAASFTKESEGIYVAEETAPAASGVVHYEITVVYDSNTYYSAGDFLAMTRADWIMVRKIRGKLNDLQEEDLRSDVVYNEYKESEALINSKASTTASTAEITRAIIARAIYRCYLIYTTRYERDMRMDASSRVSQQRLLEYKDDMASTLSEAMAGTDVPPDSKLVASFIIATTDSQLKEASQEGDGRTWD